jgi:hypothetical protein
MALLVVLVAAPTPGWADDAGPDLIGFATADEWLQELDYYNRTVGSYPDLYELFWTVEDDWNHESKIRRLTDLESRGVVPYVELTTSDLSALVSGRLDGQLDAMIATLGDWLDGDPSRRLLLGSLPEANLVDFPWGGDPTGYKAGYERIRSAFRDAGIGADQLRLVFAMHGTSSAGLSMADFYPGDDAVDIIGFSIINRNDPWHAYDRAFQRFLDEIKGTISQSKPILVTQTASVVEGQDRDGWLTEMFTKLGADSQVIGIIYFNRAKTEGGKFNDYRVLKDGWIDPAFLSGAKDWADPGQISWVFDGRMDAWVEARRAIYGNAPYFTDTASSAFEVDILWLASEGITQGCNPPTNDRFCPSDIVTRGQMAAFLARALDLSAAGGDSFVDDDGSVFEDVIERLAAAGITQGCNPPVNDRFCPDRSVTRGQMAAFLARALG